MKLECKYEIGHLIEYESPAPSGENLFGKIVEITFHKYDTVNYGVRYTISRSNTEYVDRDISETEIIADFGVRP